MDKTNTISHGDFWFKRQNVAISLIAVFTSYICIEVASSECRKTSPSFFETHPIDVNIVEGENAKFVCTVIGFDPNTETLTWHVFPDKYHTDIFDIYDESLQNKTFVIAVYDVGRDEQTFQCILRGIYHGHIFETCHSKVSTMNVQYFPKNSEINCSSNSTEDIYDGSLLAIWCTVEKGKPSVNLSYETNGLNLSVVESHLVLEGDILALRQKIYISRSLHLKTLNCVASGTSGIFQGEEITCTIGPFSVRHKPQVRIYSSQVLDSFGVAFNEIELKCIASSYPEKKVYKWLCFPHDSLTGCHNATSQTILLGTKENDTFITNIHFEVNCLVTNAEGTTMGVFNFSPSIDPNASEVSASDAPAANKKVNDTEVCIKNPPNLKVINTSVDWNMRLFEVHVICISDCNKMPAINVSTFWSVNGMRIESGSSDIIQSISPVTSSTKVAGSLIKDHEVLVVTCEILSQNVTFSNDVNVSFVKPVAGQIITGSLTTEEFQKKSQPVQFQSEISTTALETELEGQSKINRGISFNLSGVQVIVFTAVAVLVGLLLIACICAFCTFCIFKYFEKLNLINNHRGDDQKSFANSNSTQAFRQIRILDQSLDKRISSEESMYEKPITPPSSPHPRASNASSKSIHKGECIFESGMSPNSIISYHCSDSITSSICSTSSNYSNISTPPEYHERGRQTPSQHKLDGADSDSNHGNACPSTKVIYSNDRTIKMDMFQKSVSLDRSYKFENLNEKQYPLPAIPS